MFEFRTSLFSNFVSAGCSHEARLVKMVVNDLIKTFDRVPLEVAKHPMGMDSIKNSLIHKLNLDSVDEVVKVGIWGVGGIGKTTVAKALYNQVYTDFEAASFVLNVRATGLTKLQKQILEDSTKYDGKVYAVDKGISLFRNRLGGKRVLLILDDVDAVVQLNALVGDWLAPGSRVIVTSRDKHILDVARVSSECIHEMSGLEIESLQLFSWHAFLRASPSPTYEDLCKRIVDACKGHPLSLEVIGSFLYGKENVTGCWTEALENITRNAEIHERLYISYSGLTHDEKEIFLDIACFFIGEHKRFPIVFWKSLYEMVNTAVLNLSMKLLIKIDDKGVFDMHDHLRDMGRTIAEKEEGGTRLWKAAHLSTISNDIKFSRLRLEMLYRPGLLYLHLQNLSIEGMTENTLAMLPPSLIWLRLENCKIGIEKKRALKKILTAPKKILTELRKPRHIWQLKIMQIVDHFPTSPFSNLSLPGTLLSYLFSLPNIQLQHVDLRHLRPTWGLKKLPDTIGSLSQLQHLSLDKCWGLKELPDTIGNLSQLQHLSLESCWGLNNLPATIGNLSELQHLNLSRCYGLIHLPDTIGNLSQLQHLSLDECGELKKLPDTIGNLSKLQCLSLSGCEGLNNLPDTIGNLSQLQHLSLSGCWRLNNLSDTIGNLSQLQHLSLYECGGLKKLPDTIGNLSQLQHLSLKSCEGLNNLPATIGNLSQLQHLNLSRCWRLIHLPDTIGNLSQLQHLILDECGELKKLPDTIGNLSQLQHLSLSGCEGLNNLPDTIGNMSQLHTI